MTNTTQSQTTGTHNSGPTFYTVTEAARLLRVNPMTIYRAIREDAFPAIRVRSRYIIPAAAVEQLAARAVEYGGCIDVASLAVERHTTREVARFAERVADDE